METVIMEVGVAGATTARIAEKSGWTRGHVRHYLGNKDDQLRALVEALTDRYAPDLQRHVDEAELGSKRLAVYDTLFGDAWQDGAVRDNVVFDQLIAYETANPRSDGPIRGMYQAIAKTVADALLQECPDLAPNVAYETGFAVVSFAYGAATMAALGWRCRAATDATARQLLLLAAE
ncbi:TetR/AcrR family transcriptional regulator [Microbacterium sp. NPDC012755]|uniref:TetR/AcrR family transcriptional regulator n=1 Tax=Microbacterium sp. NPDC012755 TaxID=3364184 RepID=UPI0036776D72